MSPPPDTRLTPLLRRLSEVSILRFGLVGVSNTLIGFGIFWSAQHVMLAAAAQALSYAVGMLWSYYWNRKWTFKSQGNVGSEAGRFFSLQLGFMLLSSALMNVLVDHAHFNKGVCWLAISALVTVLNFVASRFWAFKPA